MDVRVWSVLGVLISAAMALRARTQKEMRAGLETGVHCHTKRHMLQTSAQARGEYNGKRRLAALEPMGMNRGKSFGHLKPFDDDEIDNDEMISVAVGPPPALPKYDKVNWRNANKFINTHNPCNNTNNINTTTTNLVRDVLFQIGRELLTHNVSEDFVFGQYLGNAMKNLTSELKLKMQHDILDLIMKYQKMNRGQVQEGTKMEKSIKSNVKGVVTVKKATLNETNDSWTDLTNLSKIVG